MDRELKRGTLEMLLLTMLQERDMYGYEIVTELQRRSADLAMKDGTLYPVLYRLEGAGHVESQWQAEGRGVPRKYYRVTDEGRAHVAQLVQEWRAFVSAIEAVLPQEEQR